MDFGHLSRHTSSADKIISTGFNQNKVICKFQWESLDLSIDCYWNCDLVPWNFVSIQFWVKYFVDSFSFLPGTKKYFVNYQVFEKLYMFHIAPRWFHVADSELVILKNMLGIEWIGFHYVWSLIWPTSSADKESTSLRFSHTSVGKAPLNTFDCCFECELVQWIFVDYFIASSNFIHKQKVENYEKLKIKVAIIIVRI